MLPRRIPWLACALLLTGIAQAVVPPGYRYIGSRVVSEGRVVYWYWNDAQVDVVAGGTAFVARLYARAAEVDRERPYVAVIRCDERGYREYGARGAFESIDDGEPIAAVWRAGCRDGRTVYAGVPAPPPDAALSAPSPPPVPRTAPAAGPRLDNARGAGVAIDPRRADTCVRFAETRPAPAGDATLTNTCDAPVEVSVCYRGAGSGAFDCAAVARGRHADSLPPGATRVLPEYQRGRNRGVALVACRGALGTVFPKLDDAGASGCY